MEPMKPMAPMGFNEPPRWWPAELGSPDAAGSQNDTQYAYFRAARRLLLRKGDEITTFDTGNHRIQGVAQAAQREHTQFVSDTGVVDLTQLKRI